MAAAALSGQSRTPPGRRAAAFSLSWDYVGGPDVGWVRTSTLEATRKPALRRDVTVQAAMAVSGAAIIGAYPAEGRMLLCTDGGHWENLGLVELLRHRCRTVVCIDASGDAPPFATTLSEAITLAYEELGVRITLTDPTGIVPGSADPLEPSAALERLNARLSRSAVLRGVIEYPEPFRLDGEPAPPPAPAPWSWPRPCSPATSPPSC